MRKLTILSCISFFLLMLKFNAQELPEAYLVAPQTANSGKYLDLPVDISTGRINHQIPLYNPLNLNYRARGISVNKLMGA